MWTFSPAASPSPPESSAASSVLSGYSRLDRDRKRTLASDGDLDYSLAAYLSRSFPPSENSNEAKATVQAALP